MRRHLGGPAGGAAPGIEVIQRVMRDLPGGRPSACASLMVGVTEGYEVQAGAGEEPVEEARPVPQALRQHLARDTPDPGHKRLPTVV